MLSGLRAVAAAFVGRFRPRKPSARALEIRAAVAKLPPELRTQLEEELAKARRAKNAPEA